MIFGSRKHLLYSLLALGAIALGALSTYAAQRFSPLAEITGTSLALADSTQGSSNMCVRSDGNTVFFVTCGGMY